MYALLKHCCVISVNKKVKSQCSYVFPMQIEPYIIIFYGVASHPITISEAACVCSFIIKSQKENLVFLLVTLCSFQHITLTALVAGVSYLCVNERDDTTTDHGG